MKNIILLFSIIQILVITSYGQYEDSIFKVVEEMPRFPGCENIDGDRSAKIKCAEEKLIEYIYSNIVYPQEAKDNRIEGNCYLQFVVTETGNIVDVEVVRDIGYGMGKAAKEVVESMTNLQQKWTPGKQRGVPVKVLFTLPVKFRLDPIEREYDANLKASKIVIINNLNIDHDGEFIVYLNEKKSAKLKPKEYESIDAKPVKNKLYISSKKNKTDSHDLKLSIYKGQTVYVLIKKDGEKVKGTQYYKLVELTPEKAKIEMADIEN